MVPRRDNTYLPWNLWKEPTKKQPTRLDEALKFAGLKCAVAESAANASLTSDAGSRRIEYMRRCLQLLVCFCFALFLLRADGQPFDLSGPKVDIHVKRGNVTLPASEVASLMPGARLWVHPDLPESQATNFVLFIAFLRRSTNPPPPQWFQRVKK